jgi:phytoene dehydrogenase-like protein
MTEKPSIYDAIIVGAGAAGLTASAYLAKAKKKILLIEKENQCGGLINSFTHNGFTFDGGIRALENAGVLFPMLKQLEIDLTFVPNDVTVGLVDKVIALKDKNSLIDYQSLLNEYFPSNEEEIKNITTAMQKIAHYMDIQYGIDNPLFLDPIKNGKYFLTNVIPWMFKYAFTVNKVTNLNIPVRNYLQKFTSDQALIDIIAQHFFADTPAFFALSYLSLYLDYFYPKGGTGEFSKKLLSVIEENGGQIQTSTRIAGIDTNSKTLIDMDNNCYSYRALVWAADQKSFYRMIDIDKIGDIKTIKKVNKQIKLLESAKGNDSVLTTYMEVDLPPEYFSKIASSHFFYTPTINGDSVAGPIPINQSRKIQEAWLKNFLANTTYEIAIPVLRDSLLAPHGKSGLIVSVLFDYNLTKEIEEKGWYADFKHLAANWMIDTLNNHIFPELKNAVKESFISSPLSIEKRSGTFQGAITGWSFTNQVIPAESRLVRIANAVKTPFSNIFQAGMWSYSPSGLPISLITGKLASDQALRKL